MRNGVILTLALLAGVALAVSPTAELSANQEVRLYYGLPGSNDYVTGTTGPNEQADAWALHSNMPQMLMDNACAANETHVYVVSGYNSSNPRYLFRCPIGGTTWETLAQPPQEISNGGAAIIGDTLYYCAGYSYATSSTVDTLWKYSISGNSWTSAPGPFTGTTYNWQPFVVACDGKVYYISGCNAPGSTAPTTQVHAYTPGAGWAQVASLHEGRVFAAGWVRNDTIWMAGGYQNSTILTATEFYCPVADTWVVDNGVFPAMPYGVWGMGSGVVGGTGFAAGGVTSSGGLVDSIAYFDHGAGSWSVDEPLYTRVYRTAGTGTANGLAWLCGGSTGGFTPTNIVQTEQLATGNSDDVGVTVIVAPTGTVSPGVIAPVARIKNFGTDPQSSIPVYCEIDSSGTNVYVDMQTHAGPLAPGATADVTFANWTAVNGLYDVTMYTDLSGDENPANDTATGTVNVTAAVWEPIPTPSANADRIVHATIFDPGTDMIYQIGGNPAGATGTYDGLCRAFDPVAETWATKASMPTPLGWCGYGLVNGKIYMIAGHNNSGGFTGANQEYDIAGNTWTTKAARPGTAVAAPLSATWRDTLIYIMGGLATSAESRVDIYDPASNSWAVGTALPLGAYMGSAVCIGDTIYIAEAYSGTCWPNLYKGAINPANPTQITWTRGPALSDPVFNGATAAVGNDVYWMGGFINAVTATNKVWKYTQATGAITEFTPSYPIINTRCTFAATRDGADGWEIYGMGGDMNGDWNAPNQTYVKILFGTTGASEQPGWLPALVPGSITPSVVRDRAQISYTLNRAASVDLGIYDVSGQLVRTLVSGTAPAGEWTATWDRTAQDGTRVARGTYFYRLTVDGESVGGKAVVVE